MSWSVETQGTKEKVREATAAEFDRCAKMYEGQEEEKDVLAAKERALAAIDSSDPAQVPLPAGAVWGVSLRASGSRSDYSTTVSVSVVKIPLLI